MTKNATNWTSMNDIFAAEENKLRAEREALKNKSSPVPVDGLSSIDSPDAAPSQVTEASQVTKTRQVTEGYIKEKSFKRKDIKSDSLKVTRLTPEDRKETVEMIVGMIAGGSYTIEQAEAQFGANLTAEDWTLVRAKASE